jgi:hypothetical protein
MYAVVRAVISEAETSELIGRTPCRGIKLPQAETVYRPVLDSDQLENLAAVLDADQAVMMYVGVVLGLRWSECAGLTVGSLNFLQGELSVLGQLGASGGLEVVEVNGRRPHHGRARRADE